MRTADLRCPLLLALTVALGASHPAAAAPVERAAAGTAPRQIEPTVDAFRADLGPLNTDGSTGVVPGRREVTWEDVPDALTQPAILPPEFYAGRRGLLVKTPSGDQRVSMDGDDPVDADPDALRFSDVRADYERAFRAFSGERVFAPFGTVVTEFRFVVPGTTAPAHVSGLGLVFTDVDAPGTQVSFFTPDGDGLGGFDVPASAGNATLSFLGVSFNQRERIGRVRVISGSGRLGMLDTPERDVVALDDVIFGEPVQTPPPPQVNLSADRTETTERAGRVFVQLTRSGDLDRTTRVRYRTVSGSAEAASDFVQAEGRVSFGRGQETTSVPVTLVKDEVPEPAESFRLEIEPVSGGAVGDRSSAEVIIAADPVPGARPQPGGDGRPTVDVRARRSIRVGRFLRRGLRVRVSADRASFADVTLARADRQLIERTVRLEAGEARKLRLRLSRQAKKRFRRVQGNLNIAVVVTDPRNGSQARGVDQVLLDLRRR